MRAAAGSCPDIRQLTARAAIWREAAQRGVRLPDAAADAAALEIVRGCPAGVGFAACAARTATAFVLRHAPGQRRALAAAVADLRRAANSYTAAHANDSGIAGCLQGFDCFFGLLGGAPRAEVARRCGVTDANLRQIVHRTKARLRPFVRDPLARRLVEDTLRDGIEHGARRLQHALAGEER